MRHDDDRRQNARRAISTSPSIDADAIDSLRVLALVEYAASFAKLAVPVPTSFKACSGHRDGVSPGAPSAAMKLSIAASANAIDACLDFRGSRLARASATQASKRASGKHETGRRAARAAPGNRRRRLPRSEWRRSRMHRGTRLIVPHFVDERLHFELAVAGPDGARFGYRAGQAVAQQPIAAAARDLFPLPSLFARQSVLAVRPPSVDLTVPDIERHGGDSSEYAFTTRRILNEPRT